MCPRRHVGVVILTPPTLPPQTRVAVCRRTVLLTGIPGVMEPESLLDLLEIHFQRKANGGGEIEAFLYNPPGGRSSALFEGVSAA